jgi:hypothetical protein
MKETQSNPMRKNKTSLRNDLENTKGSYLSNASTMEKMDTFLPIVLIPMKNIVMMKKRTTKNNIKMENPNTKRISIRKKKKILKKTINHMT